MRDMRELKRLQAVRLYGMGEAVPTIQQLVGCGPLSPRQWAIRYKQGGLDALQVHWASGNANKLTDEQRAELTEKLKQYTPDQVLGRVCKVEPSRYTAAHEQTTRTNRRTMGAAATTAATPETQDRTPGGRPSQDHQRHPVGDTHRSALA